MLTFANPLLFWALPALILPWIFRRRKEERIQNINFPLIRFLRESEEKERINPYLQELLLLILRTLLLALLIFALAGPKWIAAPLGNQNSLLSYLPIGRTFQSHVFALDASYSMGFKEGENDWWKRARQAWDILERNAPGAASQRVVWNRANIPQNRFKPLLPLSRQEVENLFIEPPKEEGTPINEFLTSLKESMEDSRSIILVTDGQKQPWTPWLEENAPDESAPSILAVIVGEGPAENYWCEATSLSSPPWGVAGWETIAGNILSLSGRSRSGSVSIVRGETEETLYEREITPPSAEQTPAKIPFFFSAQFADLAPPNAGINTSAELTFTIQVTPMDSLPLDNAVTIRVPCIDQFTTAIFGEEESINPTQSILATACNPLRDTPQTPPVKLKILSPPISRVGQDMDITVIAGSLVPWWSGVETAAAMDYIKNGGTAIIFTGGGGESPWEAFLSNLGWTWDKENSDKNPQTFSVAGTDLLAQSMTNWDESMWNAWSPARHGRLENGAAPLTTYKRGDQTRHLIANASLGKGKYWIINASLSNSKKALLSPILPAFLWEAAKEAARMRSNESIALPKPKPESNLSLLTEEDKELLTQRYGVQFTRLDELEDALKTVTGGTDLRALLLFLCALAALGESWLSNRLASM